ncbi:AAA family ATPase [Dermacoccus barathri]|uniref:AAA family ATPase n=1 Tax=Dermacoccus barathri TaxID=322601 RepID=UPI001879A136|nr:AAA family ATPase [Dermacoccus barathri]MBE7371406.1 AAA family ATPase [Dermacoccus barathri]
MRLSTIEFNGYKRLDRASCNVDGHTIAFIGPNESGKSSVLQGLAWLTDNDRDDPALSLREQNRRTRPDSDTLVVRARYRLDPDDLEALRDLNIDPSAPIDAKTVTDFRFSRRKDGGHVTGVFTTVTRNRVPFAKAFDALSKVELARTDARDLLDEHDVEDLEAVIREAQVAIDPDDLEWNTERVAGCQDALTRFQSAIEQISQIDVRSAKLTKIRSNAEKALGLFRAAAEAGELADPTDSMRGLLARRVPKFVLFSDDDRDLAESYNLSDEAVRSQPPAPLRNLLTVAGTTAEEVWSAIVSGDPATMRTLGRRMNETLSSRLEPMWTQSKLTIELALNQGGILEVNIHELDSPDFTVTPIAERSDGLRTFLGLVCFLIAADLEIPPVLMIDEAERNLHYDAQADLVRVLTRELQVHKVIYTTHSPGCLPLDLGTGIRVVARRPDDLAISTLENNFWTKAEPGFSHLLFAMGAEVAAFSAFRRAVLAEGVSEMILLPTLLRNATDGSQLDFQVAFGLSNLSAPRAISSVALITTFLVDGDQSGNDKRKQLVAAGVPKGHVFQLPKGKAIEDLVDRATYLDTVNEFLAEQDKSIPSGALAKNTTIAKAVDDYAKTYLSMPGGVSHKIIATRLALLGEDLPLNAVGRRFLSDLRPKLEDAFQHAYVLTQEDD